MTKYAGARQLIKRSPIFWTVDFLDPFTVTPGYLKLVIRSFSFSCLSYCAKKLARIHTNKQMKHTEIPSLHSVNSLGRDNVSLC